MLEGSLGKMKFYLIRTMISNFLAANYENVTSVILNFPNGIWSKREGILSKLAPAPEQTTEDVINEKAKRWVLW